MTRDIYFNQGIIWEVSWISSCMTKNRLMNTNNDYFRHKIKVDLIECYECLVCANTICIDILTKLCVFILYLLYFIIS